MGMWRPGPVAGLRGLGLLLTALLLAWQLLAWRGLLPDTAFTRLDAVVYDWRMQLLPPQRDPVLPVVVVDIDERTLQAEGRWPWDRARVADLLQALRRAGAGLVGFDVVFSERVPNPVDRLVASGRLSAGLDAELARYQDLFDGDARLAEALGPDVVLGFFLHADGASAGALPDPFLLWSDQQAAASTLAALPDYTAGLPQFARTRAGGGFVVALPDIDGVMRQVPLLLRHGQGVYPALSLEMARRALGAPWIRLRQEDRAGRRVLVGVQLGPALSIPLQPSGSLLVPYKGPAQSYPTVSAGDVLRGALTATQRASLRGALVLVGTSALGLGDLRSTPLQTAYPGVEVHANVLDALLQASLGRATLYVQPDWAPGATLALILLFGGGLSLVLPGRSPAWMVLASGIGALLLVGLNGLAWFWGHWALPLTVPLVLLASVSLLNLLTGYFLSNRQRRVIQALFGEYVPPEHVARMLAQPGAPSLDGQQRAMSVLFADVRDFTAISEPLSPTLLKQWLNRYLTAVTEVIFAHQGTVDKYVGDMVVAFWNAPLDDDEHAPHAVRAALDMQDRLTALRADFVREGLPALHIGIGVHTGLMNVGDMGSRYRRAYTVLGDAVNLGARLESLTRYYGVPILVSDAVRRQAPGFLYRRVDRVRVKGRQAALDIYQPMGAQAAADAALRGRVQVFEQAVDDYRARRWDAARRAFAAHRQAWPDDAALCRVYLGRIAGQALESLPPDWAAVHDHDSK
ncbi:CHASE2 domain-containing protein [Castellaniella hirudinis]|uniref:CHASE2 domain-containing protein n=1 Tax=Castellaniella hirudinis TaxID=1144617 RepID=UPI0039C25C78